jgi:hypothetical protein
MLPTPLPTKPTWKLTPKAAMPQEQGQDAAVGAALCLRCRRLAHAPLALSQAAYDSGP